MEKKKNIVIDKWLLIGLIFVTFLGFIITTFELTNIIYSNTYDTMVLNDILITPLFGAFLWIDNILIFIFGILYIIAAIQSKQERILKISFSLFCMLSTLITLTFAINFVAELFGIF